MVDFAIICILLLPLCLIEFVLWSSKVVDLGLGGLGQPTYAPAPEPKSSESMPGAASVQAPISAEVTPDVESGKPKEVEATTPPVGADSLLGEL